MTAKYDQIGTGYNTQRKTDPRIAQQLHSHFNGAQRVLNIGAGTGSYEPKDIDLVALEPSAIMISQRTETAHPAIQGVAEKLPFEDKSFTHTMTVLSMHHWTNRRESFNEISRVTKKKFIAMTWNPEADPFWLTRDYFPEIYDMDLEIFPPLSEFQEYFDNVKVIPLMIPEDCQDGFMAAYWKRPEAYLDPNVRRSISTFSKLRDVEKGLEKLHSDLKSRMWMDRNKSVLSSSTIDVGYAIVSAEIRD